MADDPALRAALVARDSAAITAFLELHGARLGVTESALLTPEFGASVADAPIRRRATDVVADSVDPRHATCILNMQSDPDDAKIVRSTIDLAHNLGLRVVAEGPCRRPNFILGMPLGARDKNKPDLALNSPTRPLVRRKSC